MIKDISKTQAVGIPEFIERGKERGSKMDRVNFSRTIHPEVGLLVVPLVGPLSTGTKLQTDLKIGCTVMELALASPAFPPPSYPVTSPLSSLRFRNDTNTRRVRRAKFRDKSYVRTFRFRGRWRYITCWTFLSGSYFTPISRKKPTGARQLPWDERQQPLNDIPIQPVLVSRFFSLWEREKVQGKFCLEFQDQWASTLSRMRSIKSASSSY